MTERGASYEKRDVSGRGMTIFAAAFVVITLLLIAGLTLFVRGYWLLTEEPQLEGFARQTVPGDMPRLQTDPPADLTALRAEKRDLLSGYGWVDREAGVARIPIEEAMRLTIEQVREAER